MIGRVFAGYAIVSEIGAGGMGRVYLATHRRLGRRAAVKVLLPEFASDPEIAARFFDEARATSLIDHPGIVEIYNCGSLDDQPFIVMEHVDGESLATIVARTGPLAGEPVTVASLLGQVASALAAAHAAGIVHRDLTPDNVFAILEREPAPRLSTKTLDFGVAKLAVDRRAPGAGTRPGTILGTPAYMSPEQCLGSNAVDHRSDVYALGCIAFELLTGRPPYMRSSAAELIAAHVREPAPPVSHMRPEVPPALDELVLRMMAKEPERRPASMDAVVAEVERLLAMPARRFPTALPRASKLFA
jgi:serine/threonine-protein kinase